MVSPIIVAVVAIFFVFLMGFSFYRILLRFNLLKEAKTVFKKKYRPPLSKPIPGSSSEQWESYIDIKVSPHRGKPYAFVYNQMHPLKKFIHDTHNDLCATLSGYEMNKGECETLYRATLYLHLSILLTSTVSRQEKIQAWEKAVLSSGHDLVQKATLDRLNRLYLQLPS